MDTLPFVFSGHGVNHGSCTSDNIITTVIHHHPSVSTTIIAREVLAEQQGQFLVTDALVLDIVHRHSPCSASLLPLPASSPLPISPPISLRYYKTDFQVGQTQERSVRGCITCDLPKKDGQFREDRDILLLSASHTQLHNSLAPSSTTTPHPAPQQPYTQLHAKPTPSSMTTPHPAPQQPHTQLHNPTPSCTATPHPAPQQPHTQLHSNPTPSSTATQLHDNTHPVVFLCQQAKEEAALSTKMRWSLDCINLTSASKLITCTW